MTYHLFLDDERMPPNDGKTWVIAQDFDQFNQILEDRGFPEFVSFDHDLGEGPNGKACAALLVAISIDNNHQWNCQYYVHSQNPIGKANIEGLIEGYKKFRNDIKS